MESPIFKLIINLQINLTVAVVLTSIFFWAEQTTRTREFHGSTPSEIIIKIILLKTKH